MKTKQEIQKRIKQNKKAISLIEKEIAELGFSDNFYDDDLGKLYLENKLLKWVLDE